MGLTTFKGDIPVLSDVVIAKNYSSEHEKAIDKVKTEYRKYQVKTISPVEQEYLNTLKEISSKIEIEDKK